MSKPCHIFSQNKSETQIFAFSKSNIMKKSKYQQYFHCFIFFFILVSYVTILISAVFGGTYFNVDTQRCDACQRAELICGPALIRGNTVNIPFQSSDSSDKFLAVPWFYK